MHRNDAIAVRRICSAALACALGMLTASGIAQTTAPTSQPGGVSQDWKAFHGGGALTGEAAPIPAPPMRIRWTYKVDENEPIAVMGSAAIDGSSVYVADQKGILHAIDLTSGKRLWTYTGKDGFETTPLVLKDRILLGDLAGGFHAISAADGKHLWTFDAETSIHSSANAVGDQVFFGNDGAEIISVNAIDGKLVWKQTAGDRVNGAPAISGTIYVSGCDAKLRSLALADGAQTTVAELVALCPGSPAIAENRIVVGTDGGHIQCFDLTTHKLLWDFDGIGSKAMVYSSPAISQGVVVAGARDRNVWALDLKTGEKKWSFATRGQVDSSPVISDGRVYVGSDDKKFYVLDLQTGKELWSFTASRSISAGPAVGRGVVIVCDEGGSIYCLEPVP